METLKIYFITSINYNYLVKVDLVEIVPGIYEDKNSGLKYRKRELYDCGWDQEKGYEIDPPLEFCELISLVENFRSDSLPEERRLHLSNLLGAVSVIMEDHIEEFIDFLSQKVNSGYFDDKNIRHNFRYFSLSSEKAYESKMIPGGIRTRSYEDMLKDYSKWNIIANDIVNLVYR